MRTVITGGAGFIGSHVADRFIAEGHRVFVVDDLSTGLEANVPRGASFDRLDVSDSLITRRIKSMEPDLVIHCAAQASVSRSFRVPADDAMTNVVGTIRVLEAAIAAGTKALVFLASGGALYGDTGRQRAKEDRRPRVESPYGLAKWAAEQYLTALRFPASPRSIVLRLANVYGPRQRSDSEGGVVSTFIDRMRSGGPVEIYGDGRQTRDFVFVADVVDAVVAASVCEEPTVTNIGTGARTSVNDLARILGEMIGYRGRVVHRPARPGDIRHSSVDPTRAGMVLSWHPTTPLHDGLTLTLEATSSAS